jgi:hypothetical protein
VVEDFACKLAKGKYVPWKYINYLLKLESPEIKNYFYIKETSDFFSCKSLFPFHKGQWADQQPQSSCFRHYWGHFWQNSGIWTCQHRSGVLNTTPVYNHTTWNALSRVWTWQCRAMYSMGDLRSYPVCILNISLSEATTFPRGRETIRVGLTGGELFSLRPVAPFTSVFYYCSEQLIWSMKEGPAFSLGSYCIISKETIIQLGGFLCIS